jgi:uncharacterized protein
MRRDEALKRLRQHRARLTALGVAHAYLFGSVARDQADEGSDIDVIVDTPDGTAPGLFALARISQELEHVLGRPVDVISQRGLDHAVDFKHRIANDLIDVFCIRPIIKALQARRAAQARARSVIPAQSPAAIAASVAIQEPPTHTTLASAR